MANSNPIGHKVRRLRRQQGLTQLEMARQLDISASYLNLIEHNRRRVTVPLLLKLAQLYDVDLAALADDDEARLRNDLMEVFGDVLFGEEDPLKAADVEALVEGSPEAGRAVLRLYAAYRGAVDDASVLADRLTEGDPRTGLEPARLPSEEVSDLLQDHMNHFPELEGAAESLRSAIDARGAALDAGLLEHLQRQHDVQVKILGDEAGADARRYDPKTRRLMLSEVLPPRTRLFQIAHQICLLEHGDVLDRCLARGPLSTTDSQSLARVALANYFAGAVLMPYEAFLSAARELRYDIERLGHRFRTSFEQVCHRLTTLHRPGAQGIPFHMVRVDIAGNISKRFSGSGIRFARFSGACPRWNVFAAFLQPGFIRTQLSRMPDGASYFCVARTVRREGGGFHTPQSRLAIGLGCKVSDASELVYADGVDLKNLAAAEAIGPTCRLCEREDCRQRAFPTLQSRVAVDENRRGFSFY